MSQSSTTRSSIGWSKPRTIPINSRPSSRWQNSMGYPSCTSTELSMAKWGRRRKGILRTKRRNWRSSLLKCWAMMCQRNSSFCFSTDAKAGSKTDRPLSLSSRLNARGSSWTAGGSPERPSGSLKAYLLIKWPRSSSWLISTWKKEAPTTIPWIPSRRELSKSTTIESFGFKSHWLSWWENQIIRP